MTTARWSHRDVEIVQGDRSASRGDAIAEEVPVALRYNGEPHVVMMATPADLEDFARGFSVTEDIVASIADIGGLRVSDAGDGGLSIDIAIPDAAAETLRARKRNLQGRTGCGLCGAEQLEDAIRTPRRVPAGVTVSRRAIRRALEALRGQQPLNAATGATHAAAWATPDGLLCAVREDVGRHNALDKLIGHLLSSGIDRARGFCVITSRASYEMVLKAAAVGMPIVVAISAPTAYAVRIADEAGLTLVGFARNDRHTVYACPGRIVRGEGGA
jgi:FdhD protein